MKRINGFRWIIAGACLSASFSVFADNSTDARDRLNSARDSYTSGMKTLKDQFTSGNLTRTQYLKQIKLLKATFTGQKDRIQLVLYKQMKSISVSPS